MRAPPAIDHDAMMPPLPMTMLQAGQWFRVSSVRGGCGASERLADLGLLTGAIAQVVRPSLGGPVLLDVRGSRLAIGRGLAAKVLVQPAAESPDRGVPSLPAVGVSA